jgi:hypothetical protein
MIKYVEKLHQHYVAMEGNFNFNSLSCRQSILLLATATTTTTTTTTNNNVTAEWV